MTEPRQVLITTLATVTADQIGDALMAALKERDMPAVASLLHLLAVRDPAAAELIHASLDTRKPDPPPIAEPDRESPLVEVELDTSWVTMV